MNVYQDPLEDLMGDLFVDRQDELRMYWEWVQNIPKLFNNSRALVGRRRTGKTAILTRVYNRLFYEQDRVLPVFISFARYLDRQEPINAYEFARDYLAGYVRSHLAFRYRRPDLMNSAYNLDELNVLAGELGDTIALELYGRYSLIYNGDMAQIKGPGNTRAHDLVQWAINFPKGMAFNRAVPTAIMVDEFQVLTKVYYPEMERYRDITDSFQGAVDTKWAPLLVSGSAVSLLAGQALGGLLSGRIHAHSLNPLAREYAHDLVFRYGQLLGIGVNEELAEAIWQLTRGYPYSIYCLMNSPSPARQDYPAVTALEEVTNFELTNTQGLLNQHYREELDKYTDRLNDGATTRQVMLWATKYPGLLIRADLVAAELGVSQKEVSNALEILRWVDIVERVGISGYHGPTDPMLRRYIEYRHYTEIENLTPEVALKDWQHEYRQLLGRVNRFMGEVAEVYIEAIMRAFDGRIVAGDSYFSRALAVTLPKFKQIERRTGIVQKGKVVEIDLIAEWMLPENQGKAAWLVQAKYTREPAGSTEIRDFFAQLETIRTQGNYTMLVPWYFCKGGYTAQAVQMLQTTDAFYSDLAQFNALAKLFDFFGLPE